MGNFAENLNLGNRVRPPLFKIGDISVGVLRDLGEVSKTKQKTNKKQKQKQTNKRRVHFLV